MGFNRAEKAAQYWRLITLLIILVAALLGTALFVPQYTTSLLIAALPAAVVVLLLVRFHRHEMAMWQLEIEKQLPVDPHTGATTQVWFRSVLEQECRRAIREFTPITVLRMIPVNRGETLHTEQYVELLKERMTRPGDMVSLDSSGSLQLLLPATNEAVLKFAERIFQIFNDHHTRIHLIGYTFQPIADLNGAKVSDILSQLQDGILDSGEPQIKLEFEGMDMPSVTYSI